MVQFLNAGREVSVKLVYYGPALSGKTTNLSQLFARLGERAGGRLMTLETADDRTLFFDLLPLHFQTRGGLKVKVRLFTVPGQPVHNATRRAVLQGADGVVFVADGRLSAAEENRAAWANLQENLRENGLGDGEVPVVIQFNKLDLPGTRTAAQIDEQRRRGREPLFGAVATKGMGVVETLHGLLQLTWRSLERRFGMAEKFQLREAQVLEQLFAPMDLRGTRLEGTLGRSGHG